MKAHIYNNQLTSAQRKALHQECVTVDRYEVKQEDIPNICEIQLRESGINLDELLKER